jgi:hypothetical protein
MGSLETYLLSPVVRGSFLYRSMDTGGRQRPAYTDETLARALREGIDPVGHAFETAMPRYDLSDEQAAALIAYLKTMQAEPSPGVTTDTIHLATVVAGDVDAHAMVTLLEAFVEDKNTETRHETRRLEHSPSADWYMDRRYKAYRKWALHVWRLDGPEHTWTAQLEALYAEQPVFAMVSGMADGSWAPIHEFCEHRRVPCLLPNTDLPARSTDGFYAMYYSEGAVLEGKVVASQVAAEDAAGPVVQVFRKGALGAAAAGSLSETLATRGVEVRDVVVGSDQRIPAAGIGESLPTGRDSILVLWLDLEDAGAILDALDPSTLPGRVYVSWTFLGEKPLTPQAVLEQRVYMVYPFALPDQLDQRMRRMQAWLDRRGLELDDPRIMAQTYFACMLTGEALMHVRFDYYYREFLLESIDHMRAVANYSIYHPRLSFGPGQRYVSKGSYVLNPPDPARAKEARWLVP